MNSSCPVSNLRSTEDKDYRYSSWISAHSLIMKWKKLQGKLVMPIHSMVVLLIEWPPKGCFKNHEWLWKNYIANIYVLKELNLHWIYWVFYAKFICQNCPAFYSVLEKSVWEDFLDKVNQTIVLSGNSWRFKTLATVMIAQNDVFFI